MAHRCIYDSRLEVYRKNIFLVVNATWKDKNIDIYCEELLGKKIYVRDNLIFTYMGGWLVSFGDENYRNSYGYYSSEKPTSKWKKIKKQIDGVRYSHVISENDKKMIVELYPSLKYLLKKFDGKITDFFDLARVYINYPEIEALVQMGLFKIALNKSFLKYSKEKKKPIVKWLLDNKENLISANLTVNDVKRAIKLKMDSIEYVNLQMFEQNLKYNSHRIQSIKEIIEKRFYEIFDYLQRKSKSVEKAIDTPRYIDYLLMCQKLGCDLNDDYWLIPNNPNKMHDIVMGKMKNILKLKNELKFNMLEQVLEPMYKYNKVVDGYEIFMTSDVEKIQFHCDKLYACLIKNGYINNIINQDELIIYIWKNGVPIATAQVFYDKKVGQFYGDEHGHRNGDDCLPTDEVKVAFYKWLEDFKPIKTKASHKFFDKHFYKGFAKYDKDAKKFYTPVGNQNGKAGFYFEIGREYATNFDDEIIIAAGGSGCVATNKVFHFCDSITEISRHYAPSCYAEVNPLGPIVEYDGALLSNKIEVIRLLSAKEVEEIITKESKNKEIKII